MHAGLTSDRAPGPGYVRGGPASDAGYMVADGVADLPRQLYVLKLEGDTAAFLGRGAGDRTIYKIGLSASPELRRQTLQKALPDGAFRWSLHRCNTTEQIEPYRNFEAALAGEYAMKAHLAAHGEWLGGEFYLASPADIDHAWREGRRSAEGEKL